MEVGHKVRAERCGGEGVGTTFATLLSNEVVDYQEQEFLGRLQPRGTFDGAGEATSGSGAAEMAQEGYNTTPNVLNGAGVLDSFCPRCKNGRASLVHALNCPGSAMEYQSMTAIGRSVTPRERYLSNFKQLVDEMYALTQRKNADYAGEEDPYENFREYGTLGFLVRMSDKWKRIRNLLGSGKAPQVKDERVEDTLLDLATYSLLLICWLRDGN